MYDKFAQEFNAWQQDDIIPACCDGDTLYFLKLQKERLKEKGIKMTNRVMPAKGKSYGTATLSRKSPWYTTDMVYEGIKRTIRFDNRQGSVYEREVEQVMYEIIVHTPNDAKLSHIMMTCPNCGAVSRAAELEEGCKYCGTKFRITDLYPRVVNLFFLKDKTAVSVEEMVGRTIFFSMLAVFAQQPEKLACYRGGQRDARFSDILEMTYTNAVCLRRVQVDGNILHMSLRTWWINYSESQGKVRKTGDCIDVELSRNVAVMEPMLKVFRILYSKC